MEQFLAVAAAHFLALLIPGVDFFLIARTAMTSGWRNATGVCLGIASANGIFIAAAFSGVSLISHPLLLNAIQVVGGGFLIFIGVAFLRSRARIDLDHVSSTQRTTWLRNFGLGIASGLLNPKNALFYVSLAAAVGTAAPLTLTLYGVWMFSIVLGWDVFVAVVLGSRRALARMDRLLPWLTRIAGAFLILFGGGMIASLAMQHLG
ncbi:LysE family translocator [Brevibacterium senegalense]|uniref:LysE family translocator n=1 Tax=Brevibacterium senegalense TaxID=1033736 RepID=UPI0002F6594F|nr:LysE family translocator [Brevibacterium senegalense]